MQPWRRWHKAKRRPSQGQTATPDGLPAPAARDANPTSQAGRLDQVGQVVGLQYRAAVALSMIWQAGIHPCLSAVSPGPSSATGSPCGDALRPSLDLLLAPANPASCASCKGPALFPSSHHRATLL
ncbi:uncharacterized protein PSFLO_06447 [Pseudozyma flocculosa]|uniref:Uncharacterized protein n=1 Tax=Pseudozyma flocculosa TaxID=84751 RepID=A0A5C3FBA1_9BASI|nr:uncharacterized protein PSFLO_06447 [Pseudozyma flocculosa]